MRPKIPKSDDNLECCKKLRSFTLQRYRIKRDSLNPQAAKDNNHGQGYGDLGDHIIERVLSKGGKHIKTRRRMMQLVNLPQRRKRMAQTMMPVSCQIQEQEIYQCNNWQRQVTKELASVIQRSLLQKIQGSVERQRQRSHDQRKDSKPNSTKIKRIQVPKRSTNC